jgi:hypothetical protein
MELTIKKTTEETIDIKLPAFYKSSACNFKIYSEKHCICITSEEIGIKHATLPFCLDSLTDSDEFEFLTAYNETKTKIDLIAIDI